MDFEFDPAKSLTNKDKHGIDFDRAQAIWRDEDRLEIKARLVGEDRFLTVGRVGEKVWTAVWTPRGAIVRLISVRRARDREIESYGRQQDDHD